MATKQFALPIDSNSKQTGDINLAQLSAANAAAEFRLTNVTSGTNHLNLITSKGGTHTDHIFAATVSAGVASTMLSAGQLSGIYADANGGDWDYVEINWTVGSVDAPAKSNTVVLQGGGTYDTFRWPPNH
jgi:hypothetical protein